MPETIINVLLNPRRRTGVVSRRAAARDSTRDKILRLSRGKRSRDSSSKNASRKQWQRHLHEEDLCLALNGIRVFVAD
jgi:hypothetical protein